MKGLDQYLLYLDLDGVVQHEAVYSSRLLGIFIDQTEAPGRVLFEWASILVDILEPFPELGLVLSSSWCVRPGYDRTLKRLPEALRRRFVGGTYHRRHHREDPIRDLVFKTQSRGEQIVTDVLRRKPRGWLALDDDPDDDWPSAHRGRLVRTNGALGLSDPAAQAELRLRLAQMVNGCLADS